jgi:hypothetical protein
MSGRRAMLARLGPLATVPWASALLSTPGLVLLGGAGGCASGSRTPAGPPSSASGGPLALPMAAPRPRTGDLWVFREINNYNQLPLGDLELEVRSNAPLTVEHRRLRRTRGAGQISGPVDPRAMTFSAPWSVIVDSSFDDEYRFSPAVPLLPPKLEPGSWSATSHRFTVAGSSSVYGWWQRLTATGTEVVTTPAGRFDTLVIRRQIRFDSPQPFRYDRFREEVRWYAPAVNGWVSRQWAGSYLDDSSIERERRLEDALTQVLQSYTAGSG